MINTRTYSAEVMGVARVIKENAVGPANEIEARRVVAKELLRIIEQPFFWYYDDWTNSKQLKTDKAVNDIKAKIMKWSKWEGIKE